ncbi:MAG: amidohydrolase [Paenibacillus sp.]|jgi:L-fuconolactonase|nr:amidohydrolase [Paenibacillus sp.]
MRIDSHQHYWKLDRGDYGWITPAKTVLYRDYLPEDLLPHLLKNDFDASIVVQAAATLEETDYLLSLADSTDSIIGVVGWLDLNDPAYQEHYERFSQHSKYVGFRIMIQAMEDANVMLEPHFVEALKFFAEQDVPVDLLVHCSQLDVLIRLLDQVPNLRGVIDHIAKPLIAEGVLEPWRTQMSTLAASHPKLYCKLSGMVTEADFEAWKPEDFTLYVEHALEAFGWDRVMYGSDWPVSNLAASYDQLVDLLNTRISLVAEDADEEKLAKLFGGNAKEFYKL